MIKIVLVIPRNEAMALAQMCKRFCYEDAVRFANPHDGGRERDAMLEGTLSLQRASPRPALRRDDIGPGHPMGARLFLCR